LAGEFARSGYDVKRLLRTICFTEAYQRESRPRREAEGAAFVANVAQPLRGDQLFDAVLSALDLEETELLGRRARRRMANRGAYLGGVRGVFNTTFGYDPSDVREEVAASIPQVLAMMNSPQLAGPMRASGEQSLLGRLLQEHTGDDGAVVREVYLHCLSREPAEEERNCALSHLETASDRREGFEDLVWAVLNSAEFRYRR
jgi:hypothetical protein